MQWLNPARIKAGTQIRHIHNGESLYVASDISIPHPIPLSIAVMNGYAAFAAAIGTAASCVNSNVRPNIIATPIRLPNNTSG